MEHRRLAIGFIGGGNMARAIVAGLLRAGHPAGSIAVAEPADTARATLRALDGALRLTAGNGEVVALADVLVLAVKPQVMDAVLGGIATTAHPERQTIVSVAAGIPVARIAGALGTHRAVVRAMPNQPALVGTGMSVLVAGPGATAADRARAEYVARSTGEALWLDDEALMDAVTAVSGSGPAYFYLLMEAMEAAARELGLPPEAAAIMVRQTALGAARAAVVPGADPATLRASVTSPGGTTAAALAVMEQAGLREIIRRAIFAARERGAELGRGAR